MTPKKSIFTLAKALGGMPVLGALPGSPAGRAGIRYGDIVLAVNGHRTTTALEYILAKETRADGMDVVLFRDGVERTHSLTYDRRYTASKDPASLLTDLIEARVVGEETFDENDGGAAA